ncbi:unnamed protein product [Mytilus edulis]|uniref:Uncharacterized protein n=1 Tax=Mytilus edulis TaxID=6550 RepID=A0A8S3PTZ4_MYTED|nr:unnamed protein product [Mytilus edulis]
MDKPNKHGKHEINADLEAGIGTKNVLPDNPIEKDDKIPVEFHWKATGKISGLTTGFQWNSSGIQRFARKYLIPCYLHCQVEKPNMVSYLTPMGNTLKELQDPGLTVTTSNGSVVLVRAKLMLVSVDLPARALVLNMKQFNGKYGCSICLDEGESPAGQPMLRFYPYKDTSTPRTHQSMLTDARKVVMEGGTRYRKHIFLGLTSKTPKEGRPILSVNGNPSKDSYSPDGESSADFVPNRNWKDYWDGIAGDEWGITYLLWKEVKRGRKIPYHRCIVR